MADDALPLPASHLDDGRAVREGLGDLGVKRAVVAPALDIVGRGDAFAQPQEDAVAGLVMVAVVAPRVGGVKLGLPSEKRVIVLELDAVAGLDDHAIRPGAGREHSRQ